METKFWLDSTTVRGALATVIPAIVLVLKAFRIEIGEGEQSALIEGLAALAGLVGTAYAIIGRFRASGRLTTYR